MKLLSACMMVKNEEEFLAGCLSTIIGAIDELCIIDTGSTDKTIDIIKEFEKNNPTIVVKFQEIPWCDDFSFMRNKSIDMANTKYVLVIDADEKLRFDNKVDARQFRDQLRNIESQRADIKSAAVQLLDWSAGNCVMTCASARIFTKDIRYEGIIHNSPIQQSDTVLLKGVYIDHYGYDLSPEKMKLKFERTYGSLMKQLKESPEFAHTEFYLCQLFGTKGMTDEALEWGEKYIDRHTEGGKISTEINPTVFYSIGRIYIEKNELDKAEKACKMGLSINPNDPDIFIVQSDLFHKRGRLLEMAAACKAHLSIAQQLQQSGISGKFYFSLNERTKQVMIQRIAIGCMGEALNAAMSLCINKETEPGIVNDLAKQLDEWGVPFLMEEIRARADKHNKQPAG